MPLALFPLDLTAFWVPLAIGMAFGFVLESSGFGDARRLAAQFYFTEIRVLRVMFTAIVTCMLLLLWASALGLLDLSALEVNPTYLGSGILGGFLLGIGFIIGGYCPGTSIVSAATLKTDGVLFLLGVGAGSFVFGATADSFRVFYDTAGAMGVVTLPDWLGLPVGVVAVLVVFMAAFMFWGGEMLERGVGRRIRQRQGETVGEAAPTGLWRPAVRGGGIAALVVLVLAFALPAVGQPGIDDKVEAARAEDDAALASRDYHLDPLEVLGLMHNHVQGKLGRVHLVLLDVRPEADYNLFHLVDARHATLDDLRGEAGRALAGPAYDSALRVLMSNDEAAAEAAWRILRAQGARHVYVLAGGVNLWLDRFRDERPGAEPAHPPAADDRLRHGFEKALGDRYLFAKPPFPDWERRTRGGEGPVEWKVRPVVEAPAPSGGCG